MPKWSWEIHKFLLSCCFLKERIESEVIKIYNASIYVRISKEEETHESIENQKKLIYLFAEKCEDIEVVSEYIDDGFTGANFDRPGFKAMMEDVKLQKINCIIVKDLSRLGRDYVETSRYVQNIFPFMGVRFIAINDNIDSLNGISADSNLIISVKNIMNDAYLKDISVKIRTQLEVKRKQGQFISAFATYGYLRDFENKNKLTVDQKAASIVVEIFKSKIAGISTAVIADTLNKNNVLSPIEHKKYLGLKYSTGFKMKEFSPWTHITVLRILKNDIYIGTLSQGKITTANHKIKKKIHKNKDLWAVSENNHEAIIDKEMFEMVQNILLLDTRIGKGKEAVRPLSGICVCGDCKNSMILKNNGTKEKPYKYYICSGHKNKRCFSSHIIRDKTLEDVVFKVIKLHTENNLKVEEVLKAVEEASFVAKEIEKLNKIYHMKKENILAYENKKINIYEHFNEKIIDEKDYKKFLEVYNEKIENEKKSIEFIEKKIEKISLNKSEEQIIFNEFKEKGEINNFSRNLVVNLISEILVFENKKIQINFKFRR